jgi:hypothetical protein
LRLRYRWFWVFLWSFIRSGRVYWLDRRRRLRLRYRWFWVFLWSFIRSGRVYWLDRWFQWLLNLRIRWLKYRWHTGVLQEFKRSHIWILKSIQANQHSIRRKLLNIGDKTCTLPKSFLKLRSITERHFDSNKPHNFSRPRFSRQNFDPADILVPGHLPCFAIISCGA